MAEKTLNTRQKQKYDTSTNWTTNNPVLLAGELGIESDTNKFKIGNGTSAWNELDYVGSGEVMLYSTTGQNTDGAMTQKAVTDAIPTTLSDLNEDSSHRTVTDAEKTTWNNKSNFSGDYDDLTNKPTIPTSLSELTEDSTHRLVTDTEKSTWNAKSDFSGSYNDLTNKPTIPTINVNGTPQSTINFTSDPQTQIDNIVNNTTKIANSEGGFAGGDNASATNGGGAVGRNASATYGGGAVGLSAKTVVGGAVGYRASTTNGGAVGYQASTTNGGAVGYNASATNGGAVGYGARTSNGFAGGDNAKAQDAAGNGIDAIQLGTGTNSQEKTLQIYDDNIYNANTHTLTVQNATVGGNEVDTVREEGEVESGTSGQNGYYHYWYTIYNNGKIEVNGVYYANVGANTRIQFTDFAFNSLDYFKCAFGSADDAAYTNGAYVSDNQTTYITFRNRSKSQWYYFFLFQPNNQ